MTFELAVVASPGGHVDEAMELAGRFADRDERLWITSATPQTRSLLADERTEWVPEVRAREGARAARSLVRAFRLMRENRPRALLSTGAAMTVPYVFAARALGIPTTFIESATRLTGPSVTGRIMEKVPGVRLYHQGSGWQRDRWAPFGSVFDVYSTLSDCPGPVESVLVTVGSEKFPFSRALEAVRDALPTTHITWQTGNTPTGSLNLRGTQRAWWPADELVAAARTTDVVVTHAGVGSILMALRAGRCPVVIPRRSDLGEHVDDHQGELAERLAERDLVVMVRPGDDIETGIAVAAGRRVVRAR